MLWLQLEQAQQHPQFYHQFFDQIALPFSLKLRTTHPHWGNRTKQAQLAPSPFIICENRAKCQIIPHQTMPRRFNLLPRKALRRFAVMHFACQQIPDCQICEQPV